MFQQKLNLCVNCLFVRVICWSPFYLFFVGQSCADLWLNLSLDFEINH